MEETIFTKIIKGDIPCHKVYEDDKTFAFMDIYPVQPGMVLVISKEPAETVFELSPEDYAALWETVKKVAARLQAVYPSKKRIAIQVEGLDVPHAHVKLFPIDSGAEFRAEPPTSDPDHATLAELAKALAF